jgi:hypothetical protein
MFAQHLGTGSILTCRAVRSDTITRYVYVEAPFHDLFGPHPHDFRTSAKTMRSTPKYPRYYPLWPKRKMVGKCAQPTRALHLGNVGRHEAGACQQRTGLKYAVCFFTRLVRVWPICGSPSELMGANTSKPEMTSRKLDKKNKAQALCLRNVSPNDWMLP